ncbi:hypothetical protein OF122_00530 [Pelagibacterium flavum]|uniref:DUF2214 domain-containing protein n=1 Tax=Pelagibacterium flavum TaxID=2984530 RepID=A0ABY6IS88_9HYPH|nr:hypothetical protein [Pelagibacterium sp. YIM 151497]UYQ72312.1 hypothetical protein OF122_00530 [Pelagibacterium sp. YIM 151497]
MLEAIENLALANYLRRDIFAYPIVNGLHILSLGMLVTSALLMDPRVLGAGRRVPLGAAIAVLRPVAIGALGVAVTTGALLFSVRPSQYAGNPVFLTKLGLIGLALANAGVFVLGRKLLAPESATTRLLAAASILFWILAVFAGRAIAFFGGS